MTYTLKCGNATIKNYVKFYYDDTLDDIRISEIFTDGNDSTLRAEYVTGNTVTIYKDTTLKFQGEVFKTKSFTGGGIILKCFGQELSLTEQKCPVDSGKHTKTWLSTDDNTIFTALVTGVSGWSVDVSGSTATSIDAFRVNDTMSVWQGVLALIKHGNKDIYVEDSTKTLFLTDAKGTSGNARFEEGQNTGEISWEEVKAVPKVVVYGKGDGEFQIVGSSGSGTPVHRVVDRNIISVTEANARAVKELAVISTAAKVYSFVALNPNENVETGDTVIVSAATVGLSAVSLDIVKIRRGVNSKSEYLTIQVTNTQYRKAKQNLEQQKAINEMESIINQSSMQGSGNLSQWSNAMNANNSVPCIVEFDIDENYFQDEAGNLRVNSLFVDYDVDKFKKGYGDATFDGTDPQVQNSSASTEPSVSGNTATTGSNDIIDSEGGDTSYGVSLSSGWNNNVVSENINGEYNFVYVYVYINANFSASGIDIAVNLDGLSGATPILEQMTGLSTAIDVDLVNKVYVIPCFSDVNDSITLDIYTNTANSYDVEIACWGGKIAHSHTAGSLSAADHDHSNGAYDINASDINDISIGDGVGEAGSENASEVNIYLDYWNTGTSSWDNKHSVLSTGKTLDTDVDIGNSGTYPDATGRWRIRILTDNSDADFVQCIVKAFHSVDN